MTKTPDLIVTEESEKTAGLISYWRLSGVVTLARLKDALVANGVDTKHLPKPPSDEVAFGRAVREQAAKRRLVRPLARHGAWAIVDETVIPAVAADGAVAALPERLRYDTCLRVNYTGNGPEFRDAAGGVFTADAVPSRPTPLHVAQAHAAQAITVAYVRHQGELVPEDISAWLVKLANANAAVNLRDTGGIYFVPRPAVSFWRSVVAALESVSAHKVFKIPAMTNSEAVEAITEAVAAEAEKAVATMTAELTGETQLGAKALKTRAAECTALLAKVAQYEKLLNVQLPKVVATIEGLQASVVMASLATPVSEAA